ncbi:MAG: aminotransferase class I/II-fold pyridoxal phosphate-dependent enzyme [Piscinibacter sp.]|uniref:serine hydroxymethyltransferase n=1 Tax=Piscinibacter sp. TaxID=1903157 RepID=UPI001B3F0692|nr:aminotransferase class I/II-fold pyridoxal phosphate-dependent enzyme [Piscinibacter sp.]MBP5990056.1 aminotransferase class I/II-fold pyridoxal phosphate-dependent enzyme [Piscinibacter sp.]MBP6027551.1 aminotransferase class I/II-fold pyridoxal phosphate-dependent enzyme [Piscinibacter sp.]
MLERRPWVPAPCEDLVQAIAADTAQRDSEATFHEIARLVGENRRIHDLHGINLNPASNVMNPRAEAMMAAGLGSRASLGYPGDKYEMGLEAIERIEVICAELAAEVFGAKYAEVRVASGALANLYVFMATCKPGDTIIAPPADIGGHVTHHGAGAAGLYGLKTVPAPVLADGYTVDVAALGQLAREVKPKLITAGGSLNLFAHPVAAMREVADAVGAKLLFDAAHLSGMVAGGTWANPLAQGAHVMTMSTYKSLGGPPGGLVVGNDAAIAERIDAIAYPGLTANFDAGKVAALAVTLADWKKHGAAYAQAMCDTARALAQALQREGLPVYASAKGATTSHQFAVEAARWGGGQAAAKRMARAGLLACGIGLPIAPVEGDVNGLRLGVPEIVRLGMKPEHMGELGALIARALGERPDEAAADVEAFRRRFRELHYIN